jgi:hypothetical protein
VKRFAPFVLAVLFVLLAAFAGDTANSAGEPPFSRSRWIEEQEAWGARFSGGVLPAHRERLEAFLESLGPVASPARAAVRDVRISQDILASDGSAAQPETQAEPFIALDPEQESNLLAGYQEDRFADGGARALTYAFSTDSGKHWSEGLLPQLTLASGGPFERASDPWVAFGPESRAYYVAVAFNERTPDNGIFVSASGDGGQTWGPPVAVHQTRTEFDDKEAIAVDTRTDSPFRGRLYVAWDTVTADQRQPLRFAYSDDGGGSFTPPVSVYGPGGNIGVVPLVGPQGVVYLVWTNYTFFGTPQQRAVLLAARSTDGGDTWSAPAVISDLQVAGVAGQRTGEGVPSAAVDPRTGDLYVVWQDQRFSPGLDQVVLSKSTDGGDAWSAPRLVSDGPRNVANFTPAVAVNANGVVGVAYYSLRNDPSQRVLVDEYLTTSRNRGRKFGRSVRVSTVSWDVRFAAISRGFFLGDYQGLAAARKTFYPLWIATFNPSRIDPPARQPDAFTRAMKVK